MIVYVAAIGQAMPDWVTQGVKQYTDRLPKNSLSLHWLQIRAEKRHKQANIARLLDIEGEKLLSAVPPHTELIALDRLGTAIDTPALAKKIGQYKDIGQSICIVIGGPEGLSDKVLSAAHHRWSLSALTLPHPLVRILLAEQVYRAWSILSHHPYHR